MENEKPKRKYNTEQIKPFTLCGKDEEMTEEERQRQFEVRSKGGKARQEQIARRKSMKEDLEELLNCKMSKEQATLMLGDDVEMLGNNLNVQRVMLVRAIQTATEDGSAKLLEFLRNTVGDAPKESVSIDMDIMTDSDRALIDRMSRRLTLKSDEKIG